MKNLVKFIIYFIKLPKFFFDFLIFYKKNFKSKDKYSFKAMLFDIKEKEPFDSHYLYHTSWACRVLNIIKPDIHYDFASDLRFVTQASAFTKIIQYNLSIPTVNLSNLEFKTADITNMQNVETNSLKSISCMHVVEHIGLGRYGDGIDPNGDNKAIRELTRILAPGGDFLFVVPLGKPRIWFNAHRVYSYEKIISLFNNLNLKEFYFIDDNGFNSGLQKNITSTDINKNEYGCGCFWFKK